MECCGDEKKLCALCGTLHPNIDFLNRNLASLVLSYIKQTIIQEC